MSEKLFDPLRLAMRLLCRVVVPVMAVLMIPATANAANPIQDNLVKTWNQYRLPRTLHCKMDKKFDSGKPDMMGPSREVALEYWMSGTNWRLLELTNPRNSYFDWDVRWNGKRMQTMAMDSSQLFVSEKRYSPTTSSLPLLLPLYFLVPAGGPNRAHAMTWADARSEQTRDRFSAAKPVQSGNAHGVEAIFPGGKDYHGVDYVYHIEFNGSPAFMPSKLREVSTADVDLLTIEIRYQSVQCDAGKAYLPHWMRVTSREPDNSLIYVATTTVTEIDADKPIPEETFTVDPQTASSVIDLDHLDRAPSTRSRKCGE